MKPTACPNALILGATSVLAQNLAKKLLQNDYNITLIARSECKLYEFVNSLGPVDSSRIDCHIASLNSTESIEDTLKWIIQNKTVVETIIICNGVMFQDDENNTIDEYIECINVNLILQFYLEREISALRCSKIAIIGSLFAIVPRKNKLFYSYTKALAHLFFMNAKKNTTHKRFLFHLGPMQTPMYKGSKTFYVSKPSSVASQILKLLETGSGGVYIVPRYWKYVSPIIKILNVFTR
jgi:uncharacterized protein